MIGLNDTVNDIHSIDTLNLYQIFRIITVHYSPFISSLSWLPKAEYNNARIMVE